MKLKDLIDSNNWLSVELIILELYPDQNAVVDEYEYVFDKLKNLQPENSDMSIVLTECNSEWEEENDSDTYIDVSGRKNVNEENALTESYAIEFEDWSKWLGMDLAVEAIENFTDLEVIAHCLYEMTFISFDEKEIKEQLDALNEMAEEYKSLTEEEKKERTLTLDELKDSLDINKRDKN